MGVSSTNLTLTIWLLPGEHWSLVHVERSKKLSPKHGYSYENTWMTHQQGAKVSRGKHSLGLLYVWTATRGRCPLLGRVFPLQATLPGGTLTHAETWLLVDHRAIVVGNKHEPLHTVLFLKLKYNYISPFPFFPPNLPLFLLPAHPFLSYWVWNL